MEAAQASPARITQRAHVVGDREIYIYTRHTANPGVSYLVIAKNVEKRRKK